MIKLAACGVCHSDLSVTNGTLPLPPPIVLAHESAGRMAQVGADVDGLKVGDPVITSFVPWSPASSPAAGAAATASPGDRSCATSAPPRWPPCRAGSAHARCARAAVECDGGVRRDGRISDAARDQRGQDRRQRAARSLRVDRLRRDDRLGRVVQHRQGRGRLDLRRVRCRRRRPQRDPRLRHAGATMVVATFRAWCRCTRPGA